MSIFKHRVFFYVFRLNLGIRILRSVFFLFFCQIFLLFSYSAHVSAVVCTDIADAPLEVPVSVTSVNVMFVLDDSGSMDWETLVETTANSDGVFDVSGSSKYYLYDEVKEVIDYQNDPDDSLNLYPHQNYSGRYLAGDDRARWKSQWYEHNKLYYNPNIEYTPWYTSDNSLLNADPDNPRFHPWYATPTVSMGDTYHLIAGTVDDHGNSSAVATSVSCNSDISGRIEQNGDHDFFRIDLLASGTLTVYTLHTDPPDCDNQDTYGTLLDSTLNIIEEHDDCNEEAYCDTVTCGRDRNFYIEEAVDAGTYYIDVKYYYADKTGNYIFRADFDGDFTAYPEPEPPAGTGDIDIIIAHYYVWSYTENKPFLVILDGDIKYFEFNDDGDDKVEANELTVTTSPPADVNVGNSATDYTRERQNFANWFSYYRTRWYAALNAIGKAMPDMVGMKVGYRSINSSKSHPKLIRVVTKLDGTGGPTMTLLNDLYSFPLDLDHASTPLRIGLNMVGLYYDVNAVTGDLETELLVSPLTLDPYASCTQNYAIVLTDGAWNGGSPGTGNADKYAGAPFADNQSNMLADVAYSYYDRDLAPLLENLVPTNFIDNNSRQHMVTYGVTFGAAGYLNPDDYPEADLYNIEVADRVTPPWPTPSLDYKDKLDDLYHATVNGRGKYFNSTDPKQLEDALKAIVTHIGSAEGSGASVSINGEELFPKSGGRPHLFQAGFVSDGWSGDVMSYEIAETGEVKKDAGEELWFASEVMDNAQSADSNYWNTGRVIATSNGTTGARFRYSTLTSTQQAALGADETETTNVLNYIRGDHSLEQRETGGIYRNRVVKKWDIVSETMVVLREPTILGDIVHSAPHFFDYGSTATEDKGVLFVGGNDGMLHAFATEDGKEIFGYIPNFSYTNLKELTDPAYEHKYFVDLTPYAEDIGTKSLLVGGLGKGGKGYYCLDITELDSITATADNTAAEDALAAKFQWEYPSTQGTDNDMGYSFSRAFIVNSNAGWIVIFGNGYNSTNGNAVFYILDAETGTVLKKFDTLAGSCNGLSTPVAIDVNNDSKIDYVYAGDLKGNLWKFDLTGNGADIADTLALWEFAYKDGSDNPAPLFQALDSDGNTQPITSKPDVMRHCDQKGYIVIFGTGKYLGESDFDDTSTQTIYGIWDYGDDSDDDEYLGSFTRNDASKLSNFASDHYVTLLEQTQIDWRTVGDNDLRTLSANVPNWGTIVDSDIIPDTTELENPDPHGISTDFAHAGWFFDLPKSKERVVQSVEIRNGVGIVISYIFEAGASVDPCKPERTGNSIVHELCACSGGRLPQPQFDITDDNVINDSDLIEIPNPEYEEDEDEPPTIFVSPTGITVPGLSFPPKILILDDSEIKYFSTSRKTIETVREKTEIRGLYYWQELH